MTLQEALSYCFEHDLTIEFGHTYTTKGRKIEKGDPVLAVYHTFDEHYFQQEYVQSDQIERVLIELVLSVQKDLTKGIE